MFTTGIRAVALAAAFGGIGVALAGDPGTVIHFNGGDIHGFFSLQTLITNVPAGGVGGAEDGYVACETPTPKHLGATSVMGDLIGDQIADGVSGFSVWLRDIGADDALEIHLGIADAPDNVWLYTEGFEPPEGSWGLYSVDLTDESKWTQIKGTAPFQDALTNCDRFLLRHDIAPLTSSPESIQGDFGFDRITVEPCAYAIAGVDAGGANVLSLDATTSTHLEQTHSYHGTGGEAGSAGFFLASTLDAELPAVGGTLLVDPVTMVPFAVTADGAGYVDLSALVPSDPAFEGVTFHMQLALVATGRPLGWALSNRLTGVFCSGP